MKQIFPAVQLSGRGKMAYNFIRLTHPCNIRCEELAFEGNAAGLQDKQIKHVTSQDPHLEKLLSKTVRLIQGKQYMKIIPLQASHLVKNERFIHEFIL